MTAFFSKNKRRSLLVAAVALLLCVCLCFVTACDDSTSNVTTVKTDTNDIANGDFEYYTDDDRLELIISPDSWTRSNGQDTNGNSASASTLTSGIVDVDEDLWTDLTTEKDGSWTQNSGESIKRWMRRVEKLWDDMSTYDRLHFYEALEDAIDEHNYAEDDDMDISDFDLYSDYAYEITAEDIPDCENPGTHPGAEADETGVLMIHNYRSDGYGTAQRYTSSTTVTLDPGTSAKVSVWVKTADLTYGGGTDVDGNRGAYIGVTHTVGGRTLDQMQITNIVSDEWVQYTVYIKACTFASSTFTIELGLGQGSSDDSFYYVEGYAFFDDVELDIISNGDYDAATQNAEGEYEVPYCDMRSYRDEKIFRTDTTYADDDTFALDLNVMPTMADDDFNITDITDGTAITDGYSATVAFGLTTTRQNQVDWTTDNYTGLGISREGDLTGLYSWEELDTARASNEYLEAVWEDDFSESESEYPFGKDQDIIFLLSAHGAAYTAKMDATGDLFTLGEDEYMMISFWMKTSDTSGFTGGTITLYDESTANTLGPYNTTSISTIDLDEEEDIYYGWVQCFFFVSNETHSEKSFRLEFSYGPTTITGTTKASYSEGYAAYTGFEFYTLTAEEYSDYAGSASQSTSVSLVGYDADGDGFDSVSTTDEETIETTLANPSDYTGVSGGSARTGGAADGSVVDESTNSNANAGLLNKNYVGSYSANADATAENGWLTNLLEAYGIAAGTEWSATTALENLTWWNDIFGTSTQPLLISNVVEQSYGYIGNTTNLSSNGYSTISVRVMVSAGAVAYIYLIDTSDLFSGYGSTANVTAPNVTYWYDDDGNVCLSDPTESGFNALRGTAFYLGDNGLYRNNLDSSDENYYANLANYDTDEDGNLVVKRDSSDSLEVTYEYADDYTDDGIAFYYNAADGNYYAYYDATTGEYSTVVRDFSEATINGHNFTTEYARYISEQYLGTGFLTGVTADDLGKDVSLTNTVKDTGTYIIVDGGTKDNPSDVANKWVTVSFYVRTGDDTFPYRLEVFSGSRDGSVTSSAGTFVAFDECNSGALSDSYDDLLSEAIDDMTSGSYSDSRSNGTVNLTTDSTTGRLVYADVENAGQIYANAQYYTYTFYDDPVFQRYDQTLDENESGNPYDGYVQSEYSEELTYLYYEYTVASETNYCMFLNYAAIHSSVDADEGLDTDDDEDDDEWWEDPDFWLLLSSIVLAIVLIIVLIIMLVRKLVSRIGRKGPTPTNRYDARRARYIRKLNLQTEEDEDERAEGDGEEPDDNPYND